MKKPKPFVYKAICPWDSRSKIALKVGTRVLTVTPDSPTPLKEYEPPEDWSQRPTKRTP